MDGLSGPWVGPLHLALAASQPGHRLTPAGSFLGPTVIPMLQGEALTTF